MKLSVEKLALPLFIAIVLALAIPLAWLVRARLDVSREPARPLPTAPKPASPGPTPLGPIPDDGKTADQIACQQAGGNWNPCGSACRGAPPDAVCIQVCVPQCECGGIAGFRCPAGTVCGDYEPPGAADALGVCKQVKAENGI